MRLSWFSLWIVTVQAKDELILRTKQGCGAPKFWYRIHKDSMADELASRGESRDMNFHCSTEPLHELYTNGTECIVTCQAGLKPTDSMVSCSCYRATGKRRNACRWMPRRRYSPMKCVPSHGTRDTFDLQQQLIFNILPIEQPILTGPLAGIQVEQSQIREIDELEFEQFDLPTIVHHNPIGDGPLVLMPTINVQNMESESNRFRNAIQQTGDDIVYTRTQAKRLRKYGFTIPSYRVVPVKTEVMGRLGHGDRAVVAIGSKMIQNRWLRWKDDKDAYIVPFYFSASFPGSTETKQTIKNHVSWFNKEVNGCLKLEEVTAFDFRYNAKIRVIDGNGCWSYIGMTGADPQDLSLGSYCHTKGLSLHEFIHALGFDHEQNRPDRDEHIQMHWDQIRNDKKWNFQILNEDEWAPTGHAYDFQSVMHYSSKNFASDGVGPTMTKKVNGVDTGDAITAQRDRPSTIDIQQVCAAYDCAENCGHQMKSCNNGQEIFSHRFCDGLVDCHDESDEQGCSWGCCEIFEIVINDVAYMYRKMGQHKGKDYYYSEKDNKFLFSYFTYWGFSEVLGQPTFYYYAKSEEQCPDNVSFLYYSWKVQGSATTKARCVEMPSAPMKDSVSVETPPNILSKTTAATTTTTTKATTTTTVRTTPSNHCEITAVKPVTGGTWRCSGDRCSATCNDENFRPACSHSSTLTCIDGAWNFASTSCECEMPVGRCGAIQALKGIWIKRHADFDCTNENKVGSQCAISCPYKNYKPLCRSSQTENTFICNNDLRWSNNIKGDCECRAACQAPEEQFDHIAPDIAPQFSKCTTLFKNQKCKGNCPTGTYQRKGNRPTNSVTAQCMCKGAACMWGVNRKVVDNLFCIKQNHCEHPSKYFVHGLPTGVDNGIDCDNDLKGELFYEAGTQCRINCPKLSKKISNGIMCTCYDAGNCAWTENTDQTRRPPPISAKMRIKCT